MDSRSLEFKKGIGTTSDAHLDVKFEVANNTERDYLITAKMVKEGHIIYHKEDNLHYFLKTYPTGGSLSGVTWHPLGNLKSNSLESTSEETVLTSKGASDLKNFINTSKYIYTYYLDSSLSNSEESEPNNINKPYHNLSSIVQDLIPDDGRYIRIYSISGGTSAGAALPFRNIIWDAEDSVTYDFTGVNTIAQTNNVSRSGRIITTVSADAGKNRNYFFVDGKVSLISTTSTEQQSFYAFDGKLKLSGHLNEFNFESLSGTTQDINNSVLVSQIPSELIINTLNVYSANAYHFEKESFIHIKNLSINNPGGGSSDTQFSTIKIDTLHFNAVGSTFSTTNQNEISLSNLTGTGRFIMGTNKRECVINFDYCTAASTVEIYFYGGTITGNLSNSSTGITTEAANQFSGFNAATQEIVDFTGTINGVVITEEMYISGNNEIFTSGNFVDIWGTTIDSVILEKGLTVIKSDSPAVELISGSTDKRVKVHGLLYTNSINVGVEIEYSNLSLRGVEIQDTNGITQWVSRKLQFENVVFNAVDHEIIIDTPTLLNLLPEYADNAAALVGGLASGDWYYDTTDTKITKVT